MHLTEVQKILNALVEHDVQENFATMSLHPHGAVRSVDMQEGTWEAKWEQREDCAAALHVRKFCFDQVLY